MIKLRTNIKVLAFSVAEAFIMLLVVSVALGASAPMVTKQIKHNDLSDVQMQVVNRRVEQSINQNNQTIEELRAEIEELRNNAAGVPKGTVAFFNNDVKPESNTNPCPAGWSQINQNWNGRFPRFAGTHTILSYNESTKTYNETGTEETLAVGATQEDAIRNMVGTREIPLYSAGTGVFSEEESYNGGWGYVRGNQPWGNVDFDASRVVPTSVENRPKSVALLGCVKN